jgi:hypothetical protein
MKSKELGDKPESHVDARKLHSNVPIPPEPTPTYTGSDIYRVGVRIPPFWPQEPAVWFAQVEGQIVLANITADATKFHYVLSQLDHQYAAEVKDIIISPPAANKYEKLKSELIKRLSASREER